MPHNDHVTRNNHVIGCKTKMTHFLFFLLEVYEIPVKPRIALVDLLSLNNATNVFFYTASELAVLLCNRDCFLPPLGKLSELVLSQMHWNLDDPTPIAPFPRRGWSRRV